MATNIVLIHGVGTPEPGQTAAALARTLGIARARQSTVRVDGQPFTEIVDLDSGDRVVEVNWADLMKVRHTVAGLLTYAWYLVTSMLDVAARDTDAGRLVGVRLYRWALLTVTPGAVLLTMATGIGAVIESSWLRPTILVLVFLAAAMTTWRLRSLGSHFRWLWLWTGLVGLVAVAAFPAPLTVFGTLVSLSRPARQFGFVGVMSLLTFASIEMWLRWRRKPVRVRLSYLALMYVPFIVLNGAMTWIAVIVLSILAEANSVRYHLWEEQLTPSFDFARVEAAATIVFAGVAVLAIVLPLIGFALGTRARQARSTKTRGAGARLGFGLFLAVTPVALIGLGVYSIWVSSLGGGATKTILETYETSVWRSVPYLAWLVGPFAVTLGVIGDVLFYLQPDDQHPLSTRATCRARLRAALEYAFADGSAVVVVAHSQGSVVATDLRATGELCAPLVTCGSPVSTLYEPLLGITTQMAPLPIPWVNGYRDGDFIGGPISLSDVDNQYWGDGLHTDYWSSQHLRDAIGKLAASSAVTGPS